MQKQISPKIISLAFGVFILSFLIGFYVLGWQEAPSGPPGNNVPPPLNVGTQGQAKQGGLILNTGGAPLGLIVDKGNVGIGTMDPGTNKLYISGGNLRVGGSIVDSANNTLYNDSTKKIERARLPFEQGDITSDVDTNVWDSGYYNVANLTPGNVKSGMAFGRSQTGTYSCLNWVECAHFVDTDGDDITATYDDNCDGHENYRFVCKKGNGNYGADTVFLAAAGCHFPTNFFSSTERLRVSCHEFTYFIYNNLYDGMYIECMGNNGICWFVRPTYPVHTEGYHCGGSVGAERYDEYWIYYAD